MPPRARRRPAPRDDTRRGASRRQSDRALIRLADAVTAGLTPSQVLDRVVAAAATLTGGEATVHLWLMSEDGQELRLAAEFGARAGKRGVTVSPVLKRDEGLAGAIARLGEPVVVRSVSRDPRLANPAWARDQRLVSFAGVPLARAERLLGVLCLFTWRRYHFTPHEVDLLRSFGNHAAVALENAALLDAATSRLRRLEALREIEGEILRQRDPDALLALIGRRAAELIDADSATVFLLDDTEGMLRAQASYNAPEWVRDVAIPLGQGVVGAVAQRGRGLIVNDYPRSSLAIPPFRERDWALAAQPLGLSDAVQGVLIVRRGAVDRPFTDADLTQLGDFAVQASIALENARLFAERTRAYENLKVTQDHLVQTEKLRALGEMASGVAHDFNNALAAILGRVQLVLRRVEDPTLRQWLEIVERAALDASQTVRRIQEFTRIRRDQPTELVDLHEVVRDAVEMTRARWRDETQSRGLDVQMALRLDPVPPVDGHPAELRQALTNLILNAVDALPRGGTITVSTRATDSGPEVSVADTGVGMSDEVRRRIFEPFFSTKGTKGTGLGLAMVYGIVSRHGGEVAVESREGDGATVTLRLPTGRGTGAARAEIRRVESAAARVLVIDDEEEVRDALADMLRTGGHHVTVASQGDDGIERFRAEPFDIVLTDLAMPGMSGWQVAQAVKALRPEVPVVLVTGWGVELSAAELRAHGVERVVTKPCRLDDVLEVVAACRGGLPGDGEDAR